MKPLIVDDWQGLQDKNIQLLISRLRSGELDWHISTNSYSENYCYYMSHLIQERYENTSFIPQPRNNEHNNRVTWELTNILIRSFCEEHNIEFNKLARACANVTFPGLYSDKQKKYSAPAHVDHPYPVKHFLMYLHESDGDTVIFNKKFEKNSPYELTDTEDIDILYSISPKMLRIAIFDGSYYHTAETPTSMRMVLVGTFI